MPTKKVFQVILMTLFLFVSIIGSAQTLKQRPEVPKYERGPQPSPKHVWIDEEWMAKGKGYAFIGGRWVMPPHPGYIWVFGHWKHALGGWQWVSGYWQKKEDEK